MISWPELGTRVTVRYRRPAGSVPPLTDTIGHLLETAPRVRVRTKTGHVVDFAPEEAVALRALSDKPLRISDIRALEHADALAHPGLERTWLDGWLLRAEPGGSYETNSALPLDISANQSTIPAIVDWYRSRNLVPRLAVANRLLRLPHDGENPNRVLVRDVPAAQDDVEPPTQPAWITDAPDGTRWVGFSAARATDPAGCEAILAWGAAHSATRSYLRVLDADGATADLARSLGFVLHHRARYITIATLT